MVTTTFLARSSSRCDHFGGFEDDLDLTRIRTSPHVVLGRWPTPIQRAARLDGRGSVLVKRDDLCGYGRGGAKARKIEHLIGHLLANGYDELIATAGNVTNLVFDLLPALERHNLRSRLFIIDDPPVHPRDREAIFEGVRSDIELVGTSRAGVLLSMVRAWMKSRRRGGRPFLALPGVAHPSGVLGNARGFIEMMMQLREMDELPTTVFVTAATGTTLAGALLAENALRNSGLPPVQVVGVQVYPGPIRTWTRRLLRWTERMLGVRSRVPASRIVITDAALHGGFGHFPDALASVCDNLAARPADADRCRIEIDPIFGGKTWSVMESMTAHRVGEPVLFWHCGYTPEWRLLGKVIQSRRSS